METANDDRFDFDRADRMRRALRVGKVSVTEMADYLEVSRNSVGNWINGHAEPRDRDLKRFALKTGMPLAWIKTGSTDPNGDGTPSEASQNNVSEITVWLLAKAQNQPSELLEAA